MHINFHGARILHFDVRPQGADWLLRIDIVCDLTVTLAELLEITDVLEVESAKRIPLTLDDLSLTELFMSCSGLEQHDLEMLAHSIGDFRVIRDVEDGAVERLLRFHIKAPAAAVALVAEYVKAVGQGKAKLTVNVLKQATLEEQQVDEGQSSLDGVAAGPPRKRGRRTAPFAMKSTEEPAAAQV